MFQFIILSVLLRLIFIINVGAVWIRRPPVNVFALEGSMAEFSCGVADQLSDDYIFWKQVTENDFAKIISYNDWNFNTSKYSIYVKYRQSVQNVVYVLQIRAVNLDDEGVYECQVGTQRANATLNVTVPVYNMSLEWDVAKPFPPNSLMNLTCQTFHSKPPAEISWFFGVKNVSKSASYNMSYNSDGFGDVVSILPVDTGVSVTGILYKCMAQVPGQGPEEAPSLSDYVLLFGVSSSSNRLFSTAILSILFHVGIFYKMTV